MATPPKGRLAGPHVLDSSEGYVEYLAALQGGNVALMDDPPPCEPPAVWCLRHGQTWPAVHAPVREGSWPKRNCFQNAFDYATRYGLRYVEGWAINLIPTEHAWCVTEAGLIVDPTWREDGRNYFGVVFPLATLHQIQMVTRVYGVFSVWWDWPAVVTVLNDSRGAGGKK